MQIISWFTFCLGCAIMIKNNKQFKSAFTGYINMNKLTHLWVILNKPTVDYHFEALSRSYTKADIEKRHLNPRHLMCYIFYVKKKTTFVTCLFRWGKCCTKTSIYTCTWNSGACNLITPSFFFYTISNQGIYRL